MFKACSRCGKIHDTRFKCNAGKITKKIYKYDEDKLRNTSQWHKKSLSIRERQNFICAVCYDLKQYPYGFAEEVHHIEKLKDRPDLLLEDSNLIGLCIPHHKLADSGMIDRGYLKKLAVSRDNPPRV